MSRILLTIATLSILLMVAALMAGFSIGNLYERPPSEDTLHWATVHRLTGLAAALGVVFVECIVMTYFIGTSRWCKEVVETYQFDPEIVAESNRLKRRTFPWALAGMLAVVGVISLGAASDPPARFARSSGLGELALDRALVGVAFIAWTYFVAWNNIVANHAIIERLVAQVQQVRRERGLERRSRVPTSRTSG